MERNFAAVTFFTLLFAVSNARISLDPTPTDLHANLHMQEPDCAVEPSNLRFQPKKSGSDHVPESDKDRIRSEFARFHAINRHFFDEPRVPIRSVHTRSNGNLHADGQASSKRLKFEHDYRRERYQHQHHHNDDVSMPKHNFVREKMKTRAPEAGFMTSIRKFLKHGLD